MPVSITKNQQPEEILHKMFQRAGLLEIVSFQELTEGFFNVAYEARDAAGGEYILKIAPPSGSVLMTHEKNIMWSEVHSMKRVREELWCLQQKFYTMIPAARCVIRSILLWKSSLAAAFLPGMEEMLPEEKDSVYRALGRYNRELNSLRGRELRLLWSAGSRGSTGIPRFSAWCATLWGMPGDCTSIFRRRKKKYWACWKETRNILSR